MRTWDWSDRPDEVLMHSRQAPMSTRSPKSLFRTSKPSVAAAKFAEFRMLLMLLTACADPRGPVACTLLANELASCWATSTYPGTSPPTIAVTEAACAPRGPPLTGQSTISIPCSRSLAPISTVRACSPLVQSTSSSTGLPLCVELGLPRSADEASAPERNRCSRAALGPARGDDGTAPSALLRACISRSTSWATSAEVGRQQNTTGVRKSLMSSTKWVPCSAACLSATALLRFHTETGPKRRWMWPAIGPPMRPSPMKATLEHIF
mmetsp:Transcript_109196/g.308898  ORF Transcript_109196/g.308898 Transcript_109196/m.308898 type:complete len:266 (+) Transcript_109196:303-1100(+)